VLGARSRGHQEPEEGIAVQITDVRINLAEDRSAKLQGFATITLDGSFVVRDLKIISGTKGLFVAMPSRKLTARCPRCRCKNHLRAQFCNDCGTRMSPHKTQIDERGRAKLHADIAHPINQVCRDHIQADVLKAFDLEVERSKQAGYKPARDYFDDAGPEGIDDDVDEISARSAERAAKKHSEEGPAGGPTDRHADGNMGIFA
jgi:stage V sporulation protein G